MGWIHVGRRDLLLVSVQAEILGLVVARGARGNGIGRRLLERAEAWARDRGLASVRVTSNVERAESHPFYLRLGYGRTKTSAVYHKELA